MVHGSLRALALCSLAVVGGLARADAPAAEPVQADAAAIPPLGHGCTPEPGRTYAIADGDGDGIGERIVLCAFTRQADPTSGAPQTTCHRAYLLTSQPTAPRRLASYCDRPEGDRGDDGIEVTTTTLRQQQQRGAAWSGSSACVLDLASGRVRSFAQGSYVHATSSGSTSEQDFERGVATSRWWGNVQPARADRACGEGEPDFEGEAVDVPLWPAGSLPDRTLARPRWDARCRVDLAAHGHTIAGRAHAAGTARGQVEVWGTDDGTTLALWASVSDDVVVRRAASWLATDHLELWLRTRSWPLEACLPRVARSGLAQYAVLDGGEVRRVWGEPLGEGIAASLRWLPDGMVARIDLTGELRRAALEGGVTLAYSDGDDGQQQRHVLASSRLGFADARTLGRLGSGICRVPARGAPVFDPPTTCTELIPEDG